MWECKKGLPGAMAMPQFCLIILIIFYAAYICALALRACIAIKILRPAMKREGVTGTGNVLHWMPEESCRGGRELCNGREGAVVLASWNWYANTTATHHKAPLCSSPQAALARCCAKSARKNIKNNCASCTSGKAAEITASIKTRRRTYVSEANEGHSCNLYTLQDWVWQPTLACAPRNIFVLQTHKTHTNDICYVKNHIKVIRHFLYYSSYNTVVYLSYKKTLHGDIYVQIGAIDNMILHGTSETIVLS